MQTNDNCDVIVEESVERHFDQEVTENAKDVSYEKTYPNAYKMENCPKISEHESAFNIFRALGVTKAEDENLRILDQEDSLVLVHYLEPSQKVSHVRGIIVDIDKGLVVCQSFPFTKEFLPNDPRLKFYDFTNAAMTLAYEGTILRVYYAAGKWRISTHRKIDASKSRWSGEPFEDSFRTLWGSTDYDTGMDKKYCYAFLLADPENRIVCEITEPILYHVGTFLQPCKGVKPVFSNMMYLNGELNPACAVNNENVTLPEKMEATKEELCAYLTVNNYAFVKKATGVLVTTVSGKVFKVIPPCYVHLRNLRGNDPSFERRLVYLWRDDVRRRYDKEKFGESTEISDQFLKLFPEKDNLTNLSNFLQNELPWVLGNNFEYRYVEGHFLDLEQPVYHLLENVKRYYKEDLTIEDNVRYQMSRVPIKQLFQIIEHVRNRENTEETQQQE